MIDADPPMPAGPPPRELTSGEALLEALATNRPTKAALRALWAAAVAWVEGGAAVPIERHARMPTTASALLNAKRNSWLCRAADLMPGASAYARSQEVERELQRFITRGAWAHWSQHRTPPGDASDLRAALFHIAKANNGDYLSARQIYRIIANK